VETWTKDGICWPKDLLSKEATLSHTRVLTFGYDANIVNVGGHASLNSLFEHSLNLLNDLSRERRRNLVSAVRFRVEYLILISSVGSAYYLCCPFSWWIDSQRCMLSNLLMSTSLMYQFGKALDQSNDVRDTKPHLGHIFSATQGIVFLGTPHRGSGMTTLAKLVASVAQVALQDV
jgi:hypothetical protein